jgi:hypothetical protein
LLKNLLLAANATAVTSTQRAAAAALPLLDPAEPAALALAYTPSAKSVDRRKYPGYDGKQTCANCALIALGTAFRRPCSLFPGKLVMAGGWCRSWVKRQR